MIILMKINVIGILGGWPITTHSVAALARVSASWLHLLRLHSNPT